MKIETFELERWMTTWELDVEFDITESGIYPMSMRELFSFLPEPDRPTVIDQMMDLRLGYSEARGTHQLRESLAATYSNTSADNVFITTGAIEANFLLFNVLLEAGDHVVVVHPAYQQLYSVPRGIGCDVDLWRLTPESGFRFDLDEFEKLVKPDTRLLVINTPHNPTGAVLSDEELRRIYDIAEANDAVLMVDEAYRWLELPGSNALAAPARNLGERAISVGTFSKPFGLPGLRIGWLTAPEHVVQQCWELRDYISLSPGKLNDVLALLALQHRDQIVERNRGIILKNLDTMNQWLQSKRDIVHWTPPQGGLLAMLAYNLDMPSMDLSNRLAEEYSVMLAPGSAFEYEHHLRIGLGQRPDVFADGLNRAAACFSDLRSAGIGPRT